MNILITGADGFIGRHLIRKLGEKHVITGIALKAQTIEGKKVLKLDLKNEKALRAFFKSRDFDAIIHLAAMVPPAFESPEAQESVKENFLMTFNLLQEFKDSQAKKFIFASGMSVVGETSSKLVTEETPAKAENFYTLGKLFGEMLAQRFGSDRKRIIILRISAPYGPGQVAHAVIPRFIGLAGKNEPIEIYGTGKRAQDYIYIDDVVRAFECALKKNITGVFNVASGETTSVLDLAEQILAEFSGSTPKFIIGKKKDPQENYYLKASTRKAEKELGFKAKVALGEGLRKFKEFLE